MDRERGSSLGPALDRSRPRTASLAATWHLVVAVVVTAALVLQLVLVVWWPAPTAGGLGDRLLQFVSYFTIQSNVLVAITAWSLARHPRADGRLWRVLRLDAIVAITVTGVVHYVALRPIQDLGGMDAVADLLLHVVSPVVVLLGWAAFGPRPRVDWGTVARSVVWPLLWLGYTLMMGAITDWYPYPFVDVSDLGYARVLLNCSIVTVIFLGLAAGLRWLDGALRPAPRAALPGGSRSAVGPG